MSIANEAEVRELARLRHEGEVEHRLGRSILRRLLGLVIVQAEGVVADVSMRALPESLAIFFSSGFRRPVRGSPDSSLLCRWASVSRICRTASARSGNSLVTRSTRSLFGAVSFQPRCFCTSFSTAAGSSGDAARTAAV